MLTGLFVSGLICNLQQRRSGESDPVEGVGMQIFRREHSGELRSCWSANSGVGLDSLGPQWTIGRGEHSHSRPYAMKTQRKARNVEL